MLRVNRACIAAYFPGQGEVLCDDGTWVPAPKVTVALRDMPKGWERTLVLQGRRAEQALRALELANVPRLACVR